MILPTSTQGSSNSYSQAIGIHKHSYAMEQNANDDDDIISGRSLCPGLPCDGSMSSIGSSTGVEALFSTRDLHPSCYGQKHISQFSELLVSDEESGVDVQLSIRPGIQRRASSSGNLSSLEGKHPDLNSPPSSKSENFPDRAPSEGQACSRVKLMCSFGGRIMPRPSDGKLRYVGGESRIASVNRDISYGELVAKMSELCDQSVVLKYQMPEEDLDALVSVCNDDDLENMMEEYERLEIGDGSSRLRVFLFPIVEYDIDCFLDPLGDFRDPEQLYIDAINGVLDLSFRKEVGAGDSAIGSLSNSNCNDLIGLDASDAAYAGSYQGVSPDFSSLMHVPVAPSTSILPSCSSAPSAPASPRLFVLKQPVFLDISGQHALGTTSYYHQDANMEHSVRPYSSEIQSVEKSDVTSPPDQFHFRRVLSDSKFAQLQDQRIDASASSSLHSQQLDKMLPMPAAQRHVHAVDYQQDDYKRSPLFSPDFGPLRQGIVQQQQSSTSMHDEVPSGQGPQQHLPENFGSFIHRSPSFHSAGTHVCHALAPGAAYHIVSAPSTSCLGFQGRCMCIPSQFQVHLANDRSPYGTQQSGRHLHAFSDHCGAFHSPPPCCCDHLTDGRSLWWRQCQSCLRCGFLIQSQLLNKAPLRQTESSSASSRPICGGISSTFSEGTSVYKDDTGEARPSQRLEQTMPFGLIAANDRGAQPASEETELCMVTKSPVRPEGNSGGAFYPELAINRFPVDAPNALALPKAKDFYPSDTRSERQGDSGGLPGSVPDTIIGQFTVANEADDILTAQKTREAESQLDLQTSQQVSDSRVHNEGDGKIDVLDLTSNVEMRLKAGIAGEYHSPKYLDGGMRSISGIAKRTRPSSSNNSDLNVDENAQAVLKTENLDPVVDSVSAVTDGKFGSHLSTSTIAMRDAKIPVANPILSPSQAISMQDLPFLKDSEVQQAPLIEADVLKDNEQHQNEQEQLVSCATLQGWEKPPCPSPVVNEEAAEVKEAVKDTMVFQHTSNDKTAQDNSALSAETEAIARGLQTIKNVDLEEIRQLGSGTFGTVFHGKWRGSDVAIKRIKPSCFSGRPSERDRLIADFWREACTLSQLHHPNVVAFYGVVPDGPDGTLATATEYMVNGSLKQVLQRKDRTIDRRKRLLIAMDAAFGMEYLHEKKIVHFDLKCENLLVNMRDPHRPICKVGDFGLSKVKHRTMVSGGVRGTLPWMAPELLNGSSTMVTEKVDIFSFGIVMWELLTGEEPYANMHYGAIIGGIVSNSLRPLIPTWCDPSWRSLMERCWAADPADRPSFSEVAGELRGMTAPLHPKTHGQNQGQACLTTH